MLVFNWLLAKMVEYVGKRLLLLGIVLYVIRQFTNSDYPFGTFKRVLWHDGVIETTRAAVPAPPVAPVVFL
jgi:hypothetical protein